MLRALFPQKRTKLGKGASLVGAVEDLVVEDGEVKGKSESDGVCETGARC